MLTQSSIWIRSPSGDVLTVVRECTLSIFLRNIEYFHNAVIAEIENSWVLGQNFICFICRKQMLFKINKVDIPYFRDCTMYSRFDQSEECAYSKVIN